MSWLTVLQMVGVAIAAQIAAYLLNGLPPIREFPGKTILFLRITVCLTLVPVLVSLLGSEEVTGSVRVACWAGVGAIAWALISDAQTLIKTLRRATRRDELAAADTAAFGKAPKLRAELLAEVRRRVRQRLRYAYGAQRLINVSMAPAPDAVEGEAREGNVFLVPQPKQQVETFADSRFRVVESETTILETFDDPDIAGQLLILGAPGSGKTTALLKLADNLLDRAEQSRKIPYIFELSAWRDDEQDIARWLMAQLKFEHNIDEAVSRQWIVDGDLLPLLDGLDELGMVRQQRCMEKINEFVLGELGRRVVVCCRQKDYDKSGKRLDSLRGALRLQPLEREQVQGYFEGLGRSDIWTALQDKEGFGKLLQRHKAEEAETALLKIPLFLQILAIAYDPKKQISTKAALIDVYTVRQLSLDMRKQDRKRASKKERGVDWAYKAVEEESNFEITRRYLSWLVRKLNENEIPNTFLIEQIQPSWLEDKQKSQYRFVSGFIGSLVIFLLNSVVMVLMVVPAIVLTADLTTVEAIREVLVGSILILLFGFVAGSLFGFVSGFTFCVVSDGYLDNIRTVDNFRFSRLNMREKLFENLFTGAAFGFFASATLTSAFEEAHGFIASVVLVLVTTLVFSLVFSLINSFKENFKTTEFPNQGIFSSARNLIMVAVIASPVGASIYFLFSWILSYRSESALQESFFTGISLALVFSFFIGGGLPVAKHLALRFLLHRKGHIPHNYAKFLKYTTERRLTQQIGGSFRFIHRELLDHFADMYTEPSTKS